MRARPSLEVTMRTLIGSSVLFVILVCALKMVAVLLGSLEAGTLPENGIALAISPLIIGSVLCWKVA